MEGESRNSTIMHRMLSKRAIQNTTNKGENDYDEKMQDLYRAKEYKHFQRIREIYKNQFKSLKKFIHGVMDRPLP